MFDLIEKSLCDVCFVQETLISSETTIKSLSRRWLGCSSWSQAFGRQGGVATLISPKCLNDVVSWKKDSCGHIVSTLIRIGDVDVNFVNIYASANLTDRKNFYDEYFLPGSAIVVGGDFNCYDNPLDKFGGNASIHKEYDCLRNDFSFVDVWRKLHPNKREFTWSNSSLSLGSRLDKFLISKGLFSPESKCEISPCSVSDHDFVSFVFDIPDSIKHGLGVWNINNSLLNDKVFCDRIQNLIEDHVSFFSCFPSIQDWWEFLKESIKEELIAFACNKRRQLYRDEVFLTNRLIRLRQRLVDGDISVANSICDVESHLKALHEKRRILF